jgi:phosphohistidine phosphatase SixA
MVFRRLILLFFLACWPSISYALSLDEYAANPDGHVLFIRHALAPGSGDPSHFKVEDCQTQRNLSAAGREQARKIGARLRAAKLQISAILTSQWCRCKDTATEMRLNSFYQGIVPKKETLASLTKRLDSLDGRDGVTIMVTHFVTISAITGIGVSSGGMVSYNPQTGIAKVIGD